jgi:hypothetical protein
MYEELRSMQETLEYLRTRPAEWNSWVLAPEDDESLCPFSYIYNVGKYRTLEQYNKDEVDKVLANMHTKRSTMNQISNYIKKDTPDDHFVAYGFKSETFSVVSAAQLQTYRDLENIATNHFGRFAGRSTATTRQMLMPSTEISTYGRPEHYNPDAYCGLFVMLNLVDVEESLKHTLMDTTRKRRKMLSSMSTIYDFLENTPLKKQLRLRRVFGKGLPDSKEMVQHLQTECSNGKRFIAVYGVSNNATHYVGFANGLIVDSGLSHLIPLTETNFKALKGVQKLYEVNLQEGAQFKSLRGNIEK